MMIDHPAPKPKEENLVPKTDTEYLQEISGHLKSIRSMLTFFTILVVLGIIIQVFAALI